MISNSGRASSSSSFICSNNPGIIIFLVLTLFTKLNFFKVFATICAVNFSADHAVKTLIPSAGVTITTGIISSFTNRPVDHTVGMTGEITLRGMVLPIGGLREKAIAAHRSGLQTVLIPIDNVKDLEEIPDSVKNSLKIIPVSTIEEVIKYALK